MNEEPYLILHKVRSKPAFDIAIRMCGEDLPCQPNCGLFDGEVCMAREEDWWIIPTSGHRAYPYEIYPLTQFNFTTPADLGERIHWISLPDHCQHSIDRKALSDSSPIQNVQLQLALSVLIKTQAPLVRRKL